MEYLIHILTLASLYAIVAISLNLLVGESGLISVAQAAFVGIGAYAAALLMTASGMNFFIAAALATVISGGIALVVGVIFLRLREVYYVLGTVGFNYIVWSVFLNWSSLTRGPLGIAGVPRPEFFGFHFTENAAFLLLTLAAAGGMYALSNFITRSSFGRVLRAIREDESLIGAFGYSAISYKLVIFTLAAAAAGLAGAMYGSYIAYINPYGFVVTESILMLSMIILGGLGSARGAIIGALILVALPEALRFVGFPTETAAHLRLMSYGAILILFMLYRPKGILGTFRI